MNSDARNSVTEALSALNVAIGPASAAFRQWISTRYPNWAFADVFCSGLPNEWTHVSSGDYDLCFLSDATVICETCQRMDRNHQLKNCASLLPIGALMDGSLLFIDTHSINGSVVGAYDGEQLMSGPDEKLDPNYFYSFSISYPEWLEHIKAHPTDRRFS